VTDIEMEGGWKMMVDVEKSAPNRAVDELAAAERELRARRDER